MVCPVPFACSKIPCINFIFLVKTIPRGDEMKRPNNLFQKKYISSLVIAAFLILSVLTAYNIKIGNADGGKSDNKTKTETTEKSNDVIGPVSGNDTGSATNSADSAANNDMDVEPGAEGQNGTDTLDSNAEDNGEGQNTAVIQGETVLQNRMMQIQKMKIIRKII